VSASLRRRYREDKSSYNYREMRLDTAKAKANVVTRGVSFSEAATVLDDEAALTREDPDSIEEQRFVTLGLSGLSNLLVVRLSYREPDTVGNHIPPGRQQAPERQYEKGRR